MISGVSGDESGLEREAARAWDRTSSRLLSMSFKLGNCIPLQWNESDGSIAWLNSVVGGEISAIFV
jgi:hypothetical protein